MPHPERKLAYDGFRFSQKIRNKCIYIDDDMHNMLKQYAKHKHMFLGDIVEYFIRVGLKITLLREQKGVNKEIKTAEFLNELDRKLTEYVHRGDRF